eukprot:727108-Alexandrium_andersonii.AAC.1
MGTSLVVDDVLVEGAISCRMTNAYVDPGRQFARDLGCEITEDCDISYSISSSHIFSAQTGNPGPESGPTSELAAAAANNPDLDVNDVDVIMSVAQAVIQMKEDPRSSAPLARMMLSALT